MFIRQQVVAITIAVIIFITIIELVRRRKLKEEYSWLWLVTGGGLFVFAVWSDLLKAVTRFIGAGISTSTIFFFGIIFLIVLNLYFSIVISSFANQIKNLGQELALLKKKVQK